MSAETTTPETTAVPPSGSDLLARRYATLGRHSPLFYNTPLELVSGNGVWLTDAQGRTYLDGYNNVPHVGHANPVVADAVSTQLRTINLHTRYLNSRVVEYAEALLATFDGDLKRVFFVNSGSEANELALRIARQLTGHTGVLVTDFSYHGNTITLAELTTGLTVGEPLGAHVRPLHIPDVVGADDEQALLSRHWPRWTPPSPRCRRPATECRRSYLIPFSRPKAYCSRQPVTSKASPPG
jgi:4-aminobutyrate aminotransferase-like enzyme